MKQLITVIAIILIAGSFSAHAQCCSKKKQCDAVGKTACDEEKSESGVKAYYFHASRRCATCEAVESVTKEALKENYGDKVVFKSINREKDKNNPLLKKYKVNGQTLLLVKGDKVVNLTNDAFLYARTSPSIFKKKLKSTIDPLM